MTLLAGTQHMWTPGKWKRVSGNPVHTAGNPVDPVKDSGIE